MAPHLPPTTAMRMRLVLRLSPSSWPATSQRPLGAASLSCCHRPPSSTAAVHVQIRAVSDPAVTTGPVVSVVSVDHRHLLGALLLDRPTTPSALRPRLSAGLVVRVWQSRQHYSTAPPRGNPDSDAAAVPSSRPGPRRRPPPPPGRGSVVRFILRALGNSLRSLFMPFRGQTLRSLYRSNPEELVLALAVLIVSALVLGYVGRIYFTYFYSRQFTRYPPTVAKYLRRALYFSNYSPDPKRALKNYRLALEQCDALGLDPFSDDVMGIRIQLASWLEHIQHYDAAIKVLELLLTDCRRWADRMDADEAARAGRGAAAAVDSDAAAAAGASLSSRLPKPKALLDKEAREAAEAANRGTVLDGVDAGVVAVDDADAAAAAAAAAAPGASVSDAETVWGRRSRVLRKAIGISVKLGDLYADEHVLKGDLAHERLVWAVDTALKEFRRRAVEGTRDGEGEWMTPKEMGASLESLGHSYEKQEQFQLALPLFFQALRLSTDPCHSAVIMNNLAATFAQHPVQPPYETLMGPVVETSSAGTLPSEAEARAAFLATAQRWANNARHHATDTAGAARTPECDEACAAALCTLGDIAVLQGDAAEAAHRFREARALSEKVAYAPGIAQADAGLARLPSA